MTKEQYIEITKPYRDNPKKARLLKNANRILTVFVFCSYPCLLAVLFLNRDPRWIKTTLVPFFGFLLLSAFRRAVNRKRPYEAFELPPVLDKDTKGKSFPSRHVFSAMVIALSLMADGGILLVIGAVMAAASLALGWIRVVTGVHYPSDVAAGIGAALLAVLIGCLF